MAKQHPESEAPDGIVATANGKKLRLDIPWRYVFLILSLAGLGVGGGFGFKWLAGGVASAAEVEKGFKGNEAEHAAIKTVQSADHKAVVVLQESVSKIDITLNKDIARKEARRLTDPIKNRKDAQDAYDRLVDTNMARLAAGMDPCTTLDCTR